MRIVRLTLGAILFIGGIVLVYRRYCSNITSGLYLVSDRRFSALKLRLAKSAKLAQIQPKNNDEWCP